jgi:hypothetical protein
MTLHPTDLATIGVGLVWQAALICLPMYVVFRQGREALGVRAVITVASLVPRGAGTTGSPTRRGAQT